MDKSRVCTLLLEGLSPSDVAGPLSHFQATQFSKEDFRKLVAEINRALSERALPENILRKSFEKWWGELEENVRKASQEPEDHTQPRSDSEVLSEVLEISRFVARSLGRRSTGSSQSSFFEGELKRTLLEIGESEGILCPNGDAWNHPVLIRIGPIFRDNEEKELVELIVRRGEIRIDQIASTVGVRGVSIKLFFWNEDGHYWVLDLFFHKGVTIGQKTLIDPAEAVALGLTDETIWRD